MDYLEKGQCKQSEIALHTHDRIAFRRCRRKWQLSSPFGKHLQPKPAIAGVNPHLWFGSGIHFAMEDYHGYNRFGDPREAFKAYVEASPAVPDEVEELVELGLGMLEHYIHWEKRRATWKTVWLDGKPLVEVKFSLVLEPLCHYKKQEHRFFRGENGIWFNGKTGRAFTEEELIDMGAEYVEIVYHGTFDRIVEDEYGEWWVLDYKTARAYDMAKLPLDTQISAYCWAAEQWFNKPIAGMLYIQMLKKVPKPPTRLKTGISAAKSQKTTHYLYRQALIEEYGEVSKAPKKNREFLDYLAYSESEQGDDFIRYDWVPRNTQSKINTYHNIIAEGKEILNPDLSLYPNPTRDCNWDCPFRVMCIAMEEGADWEEYLQDFEVRNETMNDEVPEWEMNLYRLYKDKYPEEYKEHCSVDRVDSLEEFLKEGKEGATDTHRCTI